MYRLIIALTLLGVVAVADVVPRDVDVQVNYLFVPVGYDDNDEVVVIVDGYLPNPCFRLNYPQVTVDALSRKVTVRPRARLFSEYCPAVTVPFTQEIYVGRLRSGGFKVVTYDGQLTEKLAIQKSSTPGPDDYLYAPVDKATVTWPSSSRWVAVLEGRFTNTCAVMAEVKVSLTGKTIQVLPIMKLLTPQESGGECLNEERSFKEEVEIPTLTDEGRYLLHVRSLNGRALNEVFYKTPKF